VDPQSSVAARPPVRLAEYLASMQARTYSTLSQIELDGLRLPGPFRTALLLRLGLTFRQSRQ
jgi:hypothetical protein